MWVAVGMACNALADLMSPSLPWARRVHTPSVPRKSAMPCNLCQSVLSRRPGGVFSPVLSLFPPRINGKLTGRGRHTGASKCDEMLALGDEVDELLSLLIDDVVGLGPLCLGDLGGRACHGVQVLPREIELVMLGGGHRLISSIVRISVPRRASDSIRTRLHNNGQTRDHVLGMDSSLIKRDSDKDCQLALTPNKLVEQSFHNPALTSHKKASPIAGSSSFFHHHDDLRLRPDTRIGGKYSQRCPHSSTVLEMGRGPIHRHAK